MKRLQIMIEEDLDEALARVSVAEGISKAAVIRRAVRRAVTPLPPLEEDPIYRFAGSGDFEPSDIDTVVYE